MVKNNSTMLTTWREQILFHKIKKKYGCKLLELKIIQSGAREWIM